MFLAELSLKERSCHMQGLLERVLCTLAQKRRSHSSWALGLWSQNNPLDTEQLKNNGGQQRLSPRRAAQTAAEMWWVLWSGRRLGLVKTWPGALHSPSSAAATLCSHCPLCSMGSHLPTGSHSPAWQGVMGMPCVARKGCHLGQEVV